MNWAKGYSASYYMTRVDAATWRDTERIEIEGGSVKREPSGLRESADVDCNRYKQGLEQWVRIYMDARQMGDDAHVAMFTGLSMTPGEDIEGTIRESKVQCYSVLKPADDVYLPRGWYTPVGVSAADLVVDLLSVTPAPVTVDGVAPSLRVSIIAEDDETNLSMIDKILHAINWRLIIGGDGRITLREVSSNPVAVFDSINNDVLETKVSITNDRFECPNVFMAIDDDISAVARDDDPSSELSTVTRGREVWMQETDCDMAADESIAEYALRRLEEEQKKAVSASYDRRFIPDVRPDDVVALHYPEQGLDGRYTVQSQSIELKYAARTSEQVIGA